MVCGFWFVVCGLDVDLGGFVRNTDYGSVAVERRMGRSSFFAPKRDVINHSFLETFSNSELFVDHFVTKGNDSSSAIE